MSSIPLLLPKYIIPWLTSNSGIAEDSLRIASAIFAGLATLHEAGFDQRIHLPREAGEAGVGDHEEHLLGPSPLVTGIARRIADIIGGVAALRARCS